MMFVCQKKKNIGRCSSALNSLTQFQANVNFSQQYDENCSDVIYASVKVDIFQWENEHITVFFVNLKS